MCVRAYMIGSSNTASGRGHWLPLLYSGISALLIKLVILKMSICMPFSYLLPSCRTMSNAISSVGRSYVSSFLYHNPYWALFDWSHERTHIHKTVLHVSPSKEIHTLARNSLNPLFLLLFCR